MGGVGSVGRGCVSSGGAVGGVWSMGRGCVSACGKVEKEREFPGGDGNGRSTCSAERDTSLGKGRDGVVLARKSSSLNTTSRELKTRWVVKSRQR